MADPSLPDPLHIDFRVVAETLRGGRANDAWMRTWLPATWSSPAKFYEGLYASFGARRGAVFKSRPGSAHDLYHECVSAHLGKRRTALIGREGVGFDRVSYETLHARCNALSAAWLDLGVEPERVVAIVLPTGIDQAVALLTAFRMGLVVSVIPPWGPSFVRDALTKIQPELTVSSGRHGALPAGLQATQLPVSAGSRVTGTAGSFTYAAGKVAAKLLAPFGTTEDGTTEVEASVLLDGAVRDAALVYALEPSDVVSAPSFEPMQHDLCLLLSTLVAGATFASLTEADLASEPGILGAHKVSVLGLTRKSRDVLMSTKGGLGASVRSWFRSLTDVIEPDRWDAFFRAVPDRKQPGFGVVTSSTSGGVSLFSAPSFEAPSLKVWPAPGRVWQLSNPAAGDLPAIGESGVFTLMNGDEGEVSAVQAVIGRWGDAYAYAGSLDIGPDAHPYPFSLLEEVVTRVGDVKYASAFDVPGRWVNDARGGVWLFVEPPVGDEPGVDLGQIKTEITRELGVRFLPERIETVPLRPRIVKGEVDRAWCRSQYLTGVMRRKARSEAFRLIGRLGFVFASPKTLG
ncbi:MAG: AMP-binding protein [Polyangiaceae bacterium]